eukprot:64466-Prorocentrum_minimum.AAC.1
MMSCRGCIANRLLVTCGQKEASYVHLGRRSAVPVIEGAGAPEEGQEEQFATDRSDTRSREIVIIKNTRRNLLLGVRALLISA